MDVNVVLPLNLLVTAGGENEEHVAASVKDVVLDNKVFNGVIRRNAEEAEVGLAGSGGGVRHLKIHNLMTLTVEVAIEAIIPVTDRSPVGNRAKVNVSSQNNIHAFGVEEGLACIDRVTEEDEIFQTYQAEYMYYVRAAKGEFCMGYKDVNDDAVWENYINQVKALGVDEVIAVAQSSFDRQKAEIEALRATMGK